MASAADFSPQSPSLRQLQSHWIPNVDLAQLPRPHLWQAIDPEPSTGSESSPSSVDVTLLVCEQQCIVTLPPVRFDVPVPAPHSARAGARTSGAARAKRPRISSAWPDPTQSNHGARPAASSDPEPGGIALGSIDVHIRISPALLQGSESCSSHQSATAPRPSGADAGREAAPLITHFDQTHLFFAFSDSVDPVPFLSLCSPESYSTHFLTNTDDDDDVGQYDVAQVMHSLLLTGRLRLMAFFVSCAPNRTNFSLRLYLSIAATSLATAPPPTRLLVRLLYPHAFPKTCNSLSSAVTAANLAHLFSAIDASHDATYQSLVPAQLATTTQLYPFQRRTIGWCLARELGICAKVRPHILEEEQRLRYVCLKQPSMQGAVPGLWLDVVNEELIETVEPDGPKVTQATSILPPHDGFLAEEMGLGKSLIMLAVVLANPFSKAIALERLQSLSRLADSSMSAPKLVKSTLIVTPPALLAQWQSEIATHTPSLTIYVYQGGSRPQEDPNLGKYDVVLTTFRCLTGEFNLAQKDHMRSRRFDRKYERPTSYLTACVFWRVVMDEAQMVGEASNVTHMLCQIPRIHSWCMTGTPFSRSITADLTHLTRFLRHPPVPYDRLLARHCPLFIWYVRQVMHRTSKAHIKAELELPPQLDVVMRLHLTAVEADSYEQVAMGFHAQVTAAMVIADRGEPEMEVGETSAQFEERHRAWVQACGVMSQALSTLRLAANHAALARRLAGNVIGTGHRAGAGPGHRNAAETDAVGPSGDTQAFAIVNVLRDASLRNVSECYRLQREMGAVKIKQALAHDRLEEYDAAIDILSTHLTHLGTLSDSLSADKRLASTQAGIKHDLARVSHLESELHRQIHQVLFLLAGLHHVKGNEEQENELYAQAEVLRRDMLKEHVVQVEKVQAVVRRDIERGQATFDVELVKQVKEEVELVVNQVAETIGGDVQESGDDAQHQAQQRPRPWAKPKTSKTYGAVGNGKRKRKHARDEDDDEDEEIERVDPELAGLYVMGGTFDDAVAVLDALDKQAALVDEWRPVLEAKLLMPLYRDQPSDPLGNASNSNKDGGDDGDGDGDQAEASPTEYDVGLESQHLAESYLAQLTLLVHDMRHIINRTAPLSSIDTQSLSSSTRRRARQNRLTTTLGEAVIDMLDLASLHESQLLADVADDSDAGLTHLEFERPLRQARLDAVVPVAGTSLAAVQQLLTRVAGDEQVELDRSHRDKCKAMATRIGMVIDHVLRQIGKVEAALVHYRKLFNARVVYFQELQEISDSVAVPDELGGPDEEWIRTQYLPGCAARMRALEDVVPRVAARRRYLRMLLESYGDQDVGVIEAECLVCADPFEHGYMTPCGHLACRACMGRWLQSQPTCPECRAHVRPSDLATVVMQVPTPAPPPDPTSQGQTSDGDDNDHDDNNSTAAPAPTPSFPNALAHSLTTTSSPTLLPGWHYTSIQGHYGAKITAVTQLVCTMIQREPAAKLLCFSQFEAILDVIKYSLALNHVQAVHFSPSSVHAFQTDRETRVLLLNAKSQAAGLTLNKARYILMVEPIANAAIDRQAITRVHRIGQRHTTHVVRFVVAGTVEERVHQLLQSKYRDLHEDDQSEGEEEEDAGEQGGRRADGGGAAALGVAKVASQAFSGRNEIVDPADMLFCLSGDQPVDDSAAQDEEEPAGGESMDLE